MFKRFCAAVAILVSFVVASPAFAQDSYSDPAGSGVLVSAANWLQGTLLGTVATVIAVIAIATVGFMMLTGRTNVRRAMQVVLGCFIMFGASTIARGILGAVSGTGPSPNLAPAQPPLQPPPQLPAPTVYQRANSTPFDPYAGAAIPQR